MTDLKNYTIHNKGVYLLQYHIVWCPKYRRKLFINDIKNRLKEIIENVCIERNCKIITCEIMPDHIHLFVSTHVKETPYKLIKSIKGRSSNILRREFPELRKMPTLWTRSYFISSIGNASSKTIKKYIENQWTK